jgi:hypothetical protein
MLDTSADFTQGIARIHRAKGGAKRCNRANDCIVVLLQQHDLVSAGAQHRCFRKSNGILSAGLLISIVHH